MYLPNKIIAATAFCNKLAWQLTAFLFCVFFTSCKKDWLEAKPDKSLVIPSTIKDYQAILDNTYFTFTINQPALGEISADDFYVSYTTWQSLPTNTERNAYIWADDVYQQQTVTDWNEAYKRILQSNIVLEGIEKVQSDTSSLAGWNNVKGSALFMRALDFYNLSQLFCKPYDITTASQDGGLPLRLKADVNQKSTRATLQQTYNQMIDDLDAAKSLLSDVPLYKTRPSKPAVYALLSRIYLAMEDYDKALLYADSCLRISNSLMDYNELNYSSINTVPRFNTEVIFNATMVNYLILFPLRALPDSSLVRSYSVNDLRSKAFFTNYNGTFIFSGSYDESFYLFSGLATDEMFLTRAECYARKGDVVKAMEDLNTLLQTRWERGRFNSFSANNSDEALAKILNERRKELCFRGIRWTDLRRLNKDPQFATTLKKELNGQVYTLPPNDVKYVLPIPDDEIRLSGLEQNLR